MTQGYEDRARTISRLKTLKTKKKEKALMSVEEVFMEVSLEEWSSAFSLPTAPLIALTYTISYLVIQGAESLGYH